tara:strand:- start:31 stop:438 length:408 start_codon:yes stop_codon:yes gene_type:complete
MMGMKKRVMRKGGGAMKKRVKKAGGGAMKKRVMRRGGGAMKKRIKKAEGGSTKKKFPDLTGDGKVTKADILKGRGVKLARGGKIPEGHHRTKDGGTAKKGLYYYMNRAKKAGKSRAGKGTVTDKALKQSAKTAKK